MSKRPINQLKANKHFCVAPWMHLHVLPNGNVQPCCIWDYGIYRQDRERFGNVNRAESVPEVMNVDGFRELRKKFLNNEYEAGCSRCYDREKTGGDDDMSMREWMNNSFMTQEMIDNTDEDGNILDIQLRYLDIRFGNICNLKCRMCGHGLSSTWFEEEKLIAERKGWGPPPKKFIHVDCYDMVEPYLKDVQEIYFAGGEPMLYPEHLQMLKKLVELGKTDVKLKYNTNLTTLKYKGVDFVDMWQHFPHVHVGASIDGMGDTVEYIRTKLSWEDFRDNFNKIKRDAPHVLITPSPTIGILNLETFAEFERFALLEGWYDTQPFGLNYVMQPEWMNIYNLPQWYKEEMIDMYRDHIAWCESKGAEGHIVQKIHELIVRLQEPADEQTVNQHMTTLESNMEMWRETASLEWREKLPHIVRLLDEHKRRSA